MAKFACSKRSDALNGGIGKNISPERHPDFLTESANLRQVHGVAVKGQRLNLVVIHDATELTMYVHFEIAALRLVVVSVTVVTPGDDVGMVADRFYQVDVSGGSECNH